jgi:hypothetical protein
MDKKTFDAFEAICKAGWRFLADTGDAYKPDYFNGFKGDCPACHISNGTSSMLENCIFCPVDVWRKKFKDQQSSTCLDGKELYAQWKMASRAERKKIAAQIAELKWTFLPYHKKLNI